VLPHSPLVLPRPAHPKMPAPLSARTAVSAVSLARWATAGGTSAGASVTWQMLSLWMVSTTG